MQTKDTPVIEYFFVGEIAHYPGGVRNAYSELSEVQAGHAPILTHEDAVAQAEDRGCRAVFRFPDPRNARKEGVAV